MLRLLLNQIDWEDDDDKNDDEIHFMTLGISDNNNHDNHDDNHDRNDDDNGEESWSSLVGLTQRNWEDELGFDGNQLRSETSEHYYRANIFEKYFEIFS